MANLIGTSADVNIPGVSGDNAAGTGVRATSQTGSGVIGTSTSGVGVWGGSQSSSGVGGMSDGGIGVHGVSKTGPGVRGDADDGTGVFGGSKTSTAVGGISNSGIGVHGVSTTADGVFGFSEMGRGVVGVAKAATGVEGNSTSGTGVFGGSQTGIGLYAKGGRLAGFFEGNVDITGSLRIRGVTIEALLERIVALESKQTPSSSTAPTTTSANPQISLTTEGSAANAVFVIRGSGFASGKLVTIRVVDEQLTTVNFQANAGQGGGFSLRQTIPCISGLVLHFSATDSRPNTSDATGVLWSNTITTTCP